LIQVTEYQVQACGACTLWGKYNQPVTQGRHNPTLQLFMLLMSKRNEDYA
jgi:hypothetical protein